MPRDEKIKEPRYDIKVSMHGQYFLSREQEEELIAYLAPLIEKMIKKDYLKWLPKDFITEDEWKVRWKGRNDIADRVATALDDMPKWRLRWAYESGMAESLETLAKRHSGELANLLAKNFYMRIIHGWWD